MAEFLEENLRNNTYGIVHKFCPKLYKLGV